MEVVNEDTEEWTTTTTQSPEPRDGLSLELKRGDKVRVRASVETPRFGWGEVDHDSVGVVSVLPAEGNQNLVVDFPEQEDWTGFLPEMEVVPDDEESSGFELLQPLTATLSSTFTDWKLGLLQAAKCINGDTEGSWQEGNMCHTEFEPAPWLAIDYGTSVTVQRVEIFNRDGFGDRTRNVYVRISNKLPRTGWVAGGSLLGHFTEPAVDGQKITISGPGLSGRYVIVQMDNGNLPLNLREVTAYGKVGA